MAVNVVDKDHRGNYSNRCKYSEAWKHFVRWQLTYESSAEQMSVRQRETVSTIVYILTGTTWLTVMRATHSIEWYDLTWWKKNCHCESGTRVWHCNQWRWRDLNTNKSIIGSTAWNHTLAKLILKQSIQCQLLYNLLLKLFSPLLFPFLCLCEVQLNTSLCPGRSFTQDHYW